MPQFIVLCHLAARRRPIAITVAAPTAVAACRIAASAVRRDHGLGPEVEVLTTARPAGNLVGMGV